MSKTYSIKRGDTWPAITAQLLHQGNPINLSGAIVRLVARSANVTIQRQATITNDLTGRVQCVLLPEDTAVAGHYHAEFEITFVGGEKTTVPNNDYFSLLIIEDL